MTDTDGLTPQRRHGLDKMNEVYGWQLQDVPGDFFALTSEHLFGTVWDRPALSIEQRRLLVVGVLAALGEYDLLEIQFTSALKRGELDAEALREIPIFLAHYAGWPRGAGMMQRVEKVLAQAAKAAAAPQPAAGE